MGVGVYHPIDVLHWFDSTIQSLSDEQTLKTRWLAPKCVINQNSLVQRLADSHSGHSGDFLNRRILLPFYSVNPLLFIEPIEHMLQ